MTELLTARWLGSVPYRDAHALQKVLHTRVVAGAEPPTLLLLEHPAVITLGRRTTAGDVLVSPRELASRGIECLRSERGGQATWHGPGQLVGYLVARARDLAPTLPFLVSAIEKALIDTCEKLGVTAHRGVSHRGVWVNGSRVGFAGLAVSRGVTWHGFSLNVSNELSGFELIHPCGLADPITTVVRSGGEPRTLPEVAELTSTALGHALGCSAVFENPDATLWEQTALQTSAATAFR